MIEKIIEAFVSAASMLWQIAWSLILGFCISGIVQTLVSDRWMRATLGRDAPREIALATAFGAASSSCSFAAAAVMKTLFKKGAGFIVSLAFLFSATNLVVELAALLWIVLAWQFAAAEWIGGIVLVCVMSVLVRVTYPSALVDEARARLNGMNAHDEIAPDARTNNFDDAAQATIWQKIRAPEFGTSVAQYVASDWSMLRRDLLVGILISGILAVFVPNDVWNALFFTGAPPVPRMVLGSCIGPLIAIATFVCSIGNVPMAAVLWSGGAGFSGVLAFLYADILIIPLLRVYQRYYGSRLTMYLGVVFYATIVLSSIFTATLFGAMHLLPAASPMRMTAMPFSLNYTFWLNCLFGALALRLWFLARRRPVEHCCH